MAVARRSRTPLRRGRSRLSKIARAEVALEDGGIERPPRRLLDELAGGEEGGLGVDVDAEPGEERREIAARDAREDGGIGALRRVEELGGDHRPQRVGREI